MEEKISILNEQLSLLTYRLDGVEEWCISLHGGGPSSKETSEYLSSCFIKNNISFSSFDFSGQGKSGGHLENSSLKRRFDESLGVMAHLDMKARFLIGTSMGGYIAMKLTERMAIQNLILFCPAAYSKTAWNLKFGFGFTEEIRRENSFLETDIEELCNSFEGNVLLVFGSHDTVIPSELQDIYSSSFLNARSFKKIILQGCTHPIHRWIQDKPNQKSELIQEVGKFVEICT